MNASPSVTTSRRCSRPTTRPGNAGRRTSIPVDRATGQAPADAAAPGPAPNPPGIPGAPGDTRERLICICKRLAPATTPTAVRTSKLIARLAANWDVEILTETSGAPSSDRVAVNFVRSRRPARLLRLAQTLRLSKLLELVIWPDDSIFWVLPAIVAGRRIVKRSAPSAIVVFMMPYSAGLIGLALARMTGLPLILNLDDSPTCTDMHPYFPSRLHYRLARALEDRYARSADAIVYVSQTNLERVSARQPAGVAERFHLVRYGADESEFQTVTPSGDGFEIAYVGAMAGWWALIDQASPPSRLKRIYGAWTRLGRYRLVELDVLTASPAVIGQAIELAVADHPQWRDRVRMSVYDNVYSRPLVTRALTAAGIDRVVTAREPVAHERVGEILAGADLLFLTLPRRVDGSPGGRISAKTYEYLMTDRPILAAVPRGESWNFLADRPGVWLAEPDDVEAMRAVVVELAAAKFAGAPPAFARESAREEISYASRGGEFENAIRAGIARKRRRQPAR
ncbi:MAG TPA: glycosyltransferase [Solirubrobacteraceae bacterium]